MIRAQVKDWFSSDVPEVWKWQPPSPDDVHYYLEMTIGPEHTPGGDLFGVMVATPQGLLNCETQAAIWGRHHLIVLEYSWQAVLDPINKLLDTCKGNTWNRVAGQLSRHLHWEYEDYQEEREKRPPH